MAAPDELSSFVRDALSQNVARADIERALTEAGWSPRQVAEALATFAEVSFPVPVPRPRAYTDAREAFLYGLATVALGLSAYTFGALLFQIIEYAFPTGRLPDLGETTRGPISMLVVSVPVFIYISVVIGRDVRADPSKRSSKNRSQTTYLTLFVCAATVIGVLAGVVYNFLGGDLTVRFILKSLTAAGIAAVIFLHYLRDMRAAAGRG